MPKLTVVPTSKSPDFRERSPSISVLIDLGQNRAFCVAEGFLYRPDDFNPPPPSEPDRGAMLIRFKQVARAKAWIFGVRHRQRRILLAARGRARCFDNPCSEGLAVIAQEVPADSGAGHDRRASMYGSVAGQRGLSRPAFRPKGSS